MRDEPVLTVSEKLAAVEADAIEAQRPEGGSPGSRKRKHDQTQRSRRKGARRRSTLSPEELAELMGIV